MTIDELRSAAAIVRDATEEGENTATRIGQLFLDVVNTLCDVATNAIKGYVVINSTSELPATPSAEQQMLGYLLGTVLYVYVGTGGDTLDGKYQSAQLKGETGAAGPAGADGHDGVDLGEVALINDLTTGGEGAALSAEMGKTLKGLIDSQTFPIVNDLTTGGEASALSAEQGKVLADGRASNYSPNIKLLDNNKWTAEADWNTTDYIPCAQGDSVVWNAGQVLATTCLHFYDSSKGYLSAYKANSAQRTITAPANAAFLRATFYKTGVNVPIKVGSIEYPKLEAVAGDGNLATVPEAMTKHYYGHTYDIMGKELVPTDAMQFANMTIGTTSNAASFSATRAIAEFPVKHGYGIVVTPSEGYNIALRFYSYENVGISQANNDTLVYSNGSVVTSTLIAPIPHDAHMCVVWVAKTNDAGLTLDEAKAGFSCKVVKLRGDYFVHGTNHRGYHTCPENTLIAFRESAKEGFAFVETDVRTTSDGVLVLLHDATINRTARNADGTSISGTVNIADITYAQALEYDFGIYKGEQYAGTKIPTLAQFLTLCKRLKLHPYLEIKAVTVSDLAQAVRDAGMNGNVTYLTGVQSYLESVKTLDPRARLAMLDITGSSGVTMYNLLKTDYNEVVDCLSNGSSLATNMAPLKEAGVPVEVYTLDAITSITSLDSYVSGVTSNKWDAGKVLYLDEMA